MHLDLFLKYRSARVPFVKFGSVVFSEYECADAVIFQYISRYSRQSNGHKANLF